MWSIFPKEFKEEIKEKYNAYKGSIYEDIYLDIFGIHNLIETKFKVGDKVVCLNFPYVWREITAEDILSLELTEPAYRPFKTQEECWQEVPRENITMESLDILPRLKNVGFLAQT